MRKAGSQIPGMRKSRFRHASFTLLLHLRTNYIALHKLAVTAGHWPENGKTKMRATSYENTLAFVHALNRKHRRPSMLQRVSWFFDTLLQGVHNAAAYDELTRKGVRPEDAVRRVFNAMQR
jgi:hypothetical protein